MDELNLLSNYWRSPQKREGALLHQIRSEFRDLQGELQAILDRFQRIELNRALSARDVEDFHRRIRRWKESGAGDISALKLYLDDLERRRRIKDSDMLFLWAFVVFALSYRRIITCTVEAMTEIAINVYNEQEQAAFQVTHQGRARPPNRAEIQTLLKNETMPDGGNFYRDMNNDAQYRAIQFAKAVHSEKARGVILDIAGNSFEKALKAQQNWMLREIDPKSTANRYAGYIDMVMSFIVGHTVAQAFMDRGVTKYQFIATIDNRTTDECRRLHRLVFRMDELRLGINAPPVYPPPHPCRSIIRAVA